MAKVKKLQPSKDQTSRLQPAPPDPYSVFTNARCNGHVETHHDRFTIDEGEPIGHDSDHPSRHFEITFSLAGFVSE